MSKKKEFAPMGSKFFLLRVDILRRGQISFYTSASYETILNPCKRLTKKHRMVHYIHSGTSVSYFEVKPIFLFPIFMANGKSFVSRDLLQITVCQTADDNITLGH